MSWLDRISYLGLVGLCIAVLIAVPVVGACLFFFPIYQIYEAMGWEFSNLGPAGTFLWGIMVDMFVVTPLFSALAFVKFLRQKSGRPPK